MAWKIDDIDLKSYGVGVIKSEGLLDMPKLLDEPVDWLDENGPDYWQDAEDAKYGEREIALSCWIAARPDGLLTGYQRFFNLVQNFYDAITAPGLHTLKYDDTLIASVYIKKRIEMVRKTSYVSSLQIGFFTLRLTVPGDVEAYPLTIKRWNGVSNVDVVTVLTNNLRVSKTLQGDIYATCSFETNTKLALKYFDFIRINSNGANDDIFHLACTPPFEKKATNKYVYNLRWEHQGKWLDHSQFLSDLGEADFYYYANFEEIIDLMIVNHNRSWFGNFQKGTIAATVRKNHKFTAESCLTVLKRLCEEYKLEYEFIYVTAGTYSINIKDKVANDKAVTLEYGRGNGLYDLSRGDADMTKLCTKLFAYGAAKNLPPTYRDGMRRLSFTGNPLSNNDELYTEFGPHEQTQFFEDIYPNRTATITAYTQVLPGALTAAEKEVYPDGKYILTDTTLFDIKPYLLGGLTAKVAMKTGDCAGLEFEIDGDRYNSSVPGVLTLIPFKDERGDIYPNATFHPAIGDEYTLVDIELPIEYVTIAEAELEGAAQDYIDYYSVPRFQYRCRLESAFVRDNSLGFEIGDRVTVTDADFGIDGLFRIGNLEYDVYRKVYELTLSDTARISNRKQVENRLAAIERAIKDTKKDEVENMRNDQQTTGELRRILLDPNDDKLKIDNIVRNQSVDARMLGLDANAPQISLTDAWFETHIGGNVEAAKQWAGKITIHNFEGVTRYEVQKIKDNAETYDPSRTWDIPETNYTALAANKSFQIYAKLDLTPESTDCEIFLDERHIDPKEQIEDGYVIYKLGNLTADV